MKAGGSRSLNVAKQLFSLPTARRVNSIVQTVDLKCGIVDNVLQQDLRHMSTRMDDMAKVVSIAFDETKLREGYEYNLKQDIIIGYEDFGDGDRTSKFAEHALLFQVQGILVKWTRPLAVMLCHKATSTERLVDIIPRAVRALKNLGLIPLITVCDQGAANLSAVKILTSNNPVVEEGNALIGQFAVDGEPIICIFDPVHELKCFRNMLKGGTKGIAGILQWPVEVNGEEVLYQMPFGMFIKLREIVGSSHGLARKLTNDHLYPTKGKKTMRVKYATQLFSATNANLFKTVGDEKLPEASKAAQVVADLDLLTDLMNGHSSKEAASGRIKESRQPFSATSLHHREFPRLCEKIKKARFYRVVKGPNDELTVKATSTPTLRSVLLTITGLTSLQKRLSTMGYESYNTRQTGQCPCEFQFSQGKSQGRQNQLPTCSQFLGNMKSVSISSMVVSKSTSMNCEEDGRNAQESLKYFLGLAAPEAAPSQSVPSQNPQTQAVFLLQNSPMGSFQNEAADESVDDPSNIEVFLSIPDRDNSEPTPNLSEVPIGVQHYDALLLAEKVCETLLKTPCDVCKSVLTATEASNVHSFVIGVESMILERGLPSPNLLKFVDECMRVFRQNCADDCHKSKLSAMVNQQLTINADVSWFNCNQHIGDLFQCMAIQLILSYCKEMNEGFKKRSNAPTTEAIADPPVVTSSMRSMIEQAMANADLAFDDDADDME
jgi:hypothetical protein